MNIYTALVFVVTVIFCTTWDIQYVRYGDKTVLKIKNRLFNKPNEEE